MSPVEIIIAVFGLGQLGLLCSIKFDMGKVIATQGDHERRIEKLERKTA